MLYTACMSGLAAPEKVGLGESLKEKLVKMYYGDAKLCDLSRYDAISTNVRAAIEATDKSRWQVAEAVLDEVPVTQVQACDFLRAHADFTLWENRWDEYMVVGKHQRMDKEVVVLASSARDILDTTNPEDLSAEQVDQLTAWIGVLGRVSTPTGIRNDDDVVVTRWGGKNSFGGAVEDRTEKKATWGQVKSAVASALK